MEPRVVFFGTPRFAVPTLDALADAGRTPIAVVTQPDRPVGRGRRVARSAVGHWASDRGVPLLQPRRVRTPEALAAIAALRPSVAVVVAFGQIFPPALLAIPRLGCVNVHASLLPRHRGASPVQAALLAGDRVSGVTTMLMDEGMDTGPILLTRQTVIGPRETATELGERLAELGAELLVETLEGLEQALIEPRPQPAEGVTMAPRIRPADRYVDWRWGAEEIDRRLRAYTPWPGLEARLSGRPVKVLSGRPDGEAGLGPPGELVEITAQGLRVRCGDGLVFRLETVQRPGRRAVTGLDFAHGSRLEPGALFEPGGDDGPSTPV